MKRVFFDVANTLLYKPDLFDRIVTVLHNHNLVLSKGSLQKTHKWLSEVIKFPDKTSHEFYKNFNREFLYALGLIPSDELVNDIFEACKYLPWEAYEDVSALKKIEAPMGIISNWDLSLQDKLSEYVSANFDLIIGSQEFGVSKPNPLIFQEAIKQSNCLPEEIMYIGDSIKLDMEEALNQGIRAILVDRDNVWENYQGERIQSLNELIKIL